VCKEEANPMVKQRKAQSESAQSGGEGIGMLRMAANWAIAAASLAAVGGFGYWAFSLGTRNPNEVPIIRAMEGPARITPDNPGGEQTSNQGLAVNTVQSSGGVQAPSKRVVLAPEPQALAPEDVAKAKLKTAAPAPKPKIKVATQVDKPKTAVAKQASTRVIRDTPYSPGRSLRPAMRPTKRLASQLTNVQQAAARSTTPAAENAAERSTLSVPLGTRLVQLGAYDSTKLAKQEWDKLFAKHGDLLDGKKRLIQAAESGGRKFYRLRAVGFASKEESRTLCSALLARGTPCIPVTAR